MGGLPIIVALSGFLFLVAMVHYHTLQRMRELIQSLAESSYDVSQKLLQLFSDQLEQGAQSPGTVPEAFQKALFELTKLNPQEDTEKIFRHGETSVRMVQQFRQKNFIPQASSEDNGLDYQIKRLEQLQQKYRFHSQDYNERLQTFPYSLLAKAFGMKAVAVA